MAKPENIIVNVAANLGSWLTYRRWVGITAPAVVLSAGFGLWSLPVPWWIGMVVAGVGALLVACVAWYEEQSDEIDALALARDQLLENKIAPLLELAAQTPRKSARERREQVSLVAQRVAADLAYAFLEVLGVRVVVYAVSDDEQALVPIAYEGRQQIPQPFFKGTDRGDKAFEVLETLRERYITVPDLALEAPDRWAGSSDGYSTFISAPVRDGRRAYGMLTVDAVSPNSLDRQHGATLATFAAALGFFFAESKRKSGGSSSVLSTKGGA